MNKFKVGMNLYNISAGDIDMGDYVAWTADKALDLYADEAGYDSYKQLVAELGEDVAVVTELDTVALVRAVQDGIKTTIFRDHYGDGIALVDGKSVATYNDLARLIGKSSLDFLVK